MVSKCLFWETGFIGRTSQRDRKSLPRDWLSACISCSPWAADKGKALQHDWSWPFWMLGLLWCQGGIAGESWLAQQWFLIYNDKPAFKNLSWNVQFLQAQASVQMQNCRILLAWIFAWVAYKSLARAAWTSLLLCCNASLADCSSNPIERSCSSASGVTGTAVCKARL